MKNISNRQVLVILIAIALVSVFFSALTTETLNGDWLSGLMSNLGTEMIGAVMTYGLFEIILGGQEKQKQQDERKQQLIREQDERKQQLIREIGINDNGIALRAVNELRANGWLQDGSLQTADIRGANLHGADLRNANLGGASLGKANLLEASLANANLQGASLVNANLQSASLWEASLQHADLSEANLQSASLERANLERVSLAKANLQGASLVNANLQRAYLGDANLQDSILMGANLLGAVLEFATFNERTVLPDALFMVDKDTYNKFWTPETDMIRYTHSYHPDFWQPDWVKEEQAKK